LIFERSVPGSGRTDAGEGVVLCDCSVSHQCVPALRSAEGVPRSCLKGKSWVDFRAVKDSTGDFFLAVVCVNFS